MEVLQSAALRFLTPFVENCPSAPGLKQAECSESKLLEIAESGMAQDRTPTNRCDDGGTHGAGLRGARNRTDRAEAPPASIASLLHALQVSLHPRCRPHGRLKRKGSQVVDEERGLVRFLRLSRWRSRSFSKREDGKEILATGLGSVDWRGPWRSRGGAGRALALSLQLRISSSETGTSHWMSDWWQARSFPKRTQPTCQCAGWSGSRPTLLSVQLGLHAM